MSTRKFLILVFAGLALLSSLAYLWRPQKDFKGKTPLVWVSDNNPARTAQIAAFNRENPNLHLYLDYGNAGMQKMILQCSSGVGPDLFDFGDADTQAYVEAGILWDVTEPAERMGFSVRKDGWPGGVEAGLCFGRQYGYYCNIGVPILIYNKNVFDHFGVPYPKEQMTWDEFIELAAKVNSVTMEGPKNNPLIFAVSGAEWRSYFDSQRGEYFTEEGLLNIRSPELHNAFQFHKDMLFKYRYMPTTVEVKQMSGQGGWGSGNLNQFAVGRYAMIFNGDWTLIAFTQAYLHQVKQHKADSAHDPLTRPLRLGASMIPHIAGREPGFKVTSRMAGINLESPRREEALRVLQYFAGPTYSALINEGTDWLPGNPRYADLGVKEEYPDLARVQMHDTTKKAMSYGYVQRRSPFLLTGDVSRVLAAQISRLESDPRLEIADLLTAAEAELIVLLRRNLDGSADLKKLYEERVAPSNLTQPSPIPPTP